MVVVRQDGDDLGSVELAGTSAIRDNKFVNKGGVIGCGLVAIANIGAISALRELRPVGLLSE